MHALPIIFYVFSAIALLSAIAVITVSNPVHSVLLLVITFCASSGIWMLLHAEFLSLILVLVYVGAVMTLFLFSVMMLNSNSEIKKRFSYKFLPLSLIAIFLFTAILLAALHNDRFLVFISPDPAVFSVDYSNTKTLGVEFFTYYLYPFEIAGMLLLAAMIAAITLTHRGPLKRKVQSPSEQINVKKEDRIRLLKTVPFKKFGSSKSNSP